MATWGIEMAESTKLAIVALSIMLFLFGATWCYMKVFKDAQDDSHF